MNCECCKKELKLENWPWSYKVIYRLCLECKLKCEKILNDEFKKRK